MCSMLSDKPLEINIVVVKFSACLLYGKRKGTIHNDNTKSEKISKSILRRLPKHFLNTAEEQNY